MTEVFAYPGTKIVWLDTPRRDNSFTENSQEDTKISLVFYIPNTSPIILGGREFVHTSQNTEVTCRNNYIRFSISTRSCS